MNDDARRMYNTNSQIKFKMPMPNLSLCGYSDAYILVSRTVTVVGAGADAAAITADRNNKQAVFKNCAPFTYCVTEIKTKTKADNAKDLDVILSMYNLIEYSNNYSKTSRNLYQFCKDEPNDDKTGSESFKS